MKYLFLFLACMALYSCKKDQAIMQEQTTEMAPAEPYDAYVGNYASVRYFSSVTNPMNNTIDTDTINNITIEIQKQATDTYRVYSNGNLLFTTTRFENNAYTCDCPSGPCPLLKFYNTDSVYVYKKVSNASWNTYRGKKQ